MVTDDNDIPQEPPTAGEQADTLRTAGQRRVNLIWETTQASIALSVTGTALYVTANTISEAAFSVLSNGFFLVIGFYFGRTNHARSGGVGPNDYGR